MLVANIFASTMLYFPSSMATVTSLMQNRIIIIIMKSIHVKDISSKYNTTLLKTKKYWTCQWTSNIPMPVSNLILHLLIWATIYSESQCLDGSLMENWSNYPHSNIPI